MDATENRYSLAFKQIAKITNSGLPLRKLVNTIAGSAAKALQVQGCSVLMLNPQKEYLDVIGAYGLSDFYLRKGPIKSHESYAEILDGKIVTVDDIVT
ncbi:MAG: hypothetical protein NTZ34_04780, partial [Chloroflexi bacterium]|nr:hypothetical protein [Chloroflexota bacterium]